MHLLNSKFIQNWLRVNFDIIFISETHLTKGQVFEIDGFSARHNAYSTVDDVKTRGGVSCFVVPNYLRHIMSFDMDIPDNIVLTFKNGDIIFGTYIAPTDSPYFDVTDFSKVANMFVPVNQNRVILGGGDMNGRVGDVKMNLPNSMSYLPNVDGVLNDHGKEITKICRSFKCFIVNNMKFKQKIFKSDFTFHKGDRKSQNDLLLANMAALEALQKFTVHDHLWNPSDHNPIAVSFELNVLKDDCSVLASADIADESTYENIKKPKKIYSSTVNWDSYNQLVESDLESYESKVEELTQTRSLKNLDSLVSAFSHSCYTAAKANTQPPRDADGAECRGGIFDVIEDICVRQQAAVNNDGWKELREEAVEHIRKDVSVTEQQNWSMVMNSSDTKSLWKKINWKGTFTKSDESKKPDLQDLARHFSEKGQAGRDSTVLCEVSGSSYVPALDDEISIDEIVSAGKRLKEDKASGDGWAKRMVTNLPMSLLLVLQLIYNTILKFHVFPTAWRTTVVSEIFKNKGIPSVSKNYRGISLVQLLAKLFDFILLDRFKKWFFPADGQTAYQEKKGSPDHVFLLRCVMHHAKRYKEKLFLIAIDFDGAFDRVCRSLLVRKLCLFGAGTIFTACLASIYMCTENIMFRGNSHVKYKLYSGIKQGLPLSPLLFLFYINDVFKYLELIYDGGKHVLDVLHILIHADDATIIARERTGAIAKLKSMLEYCNLNRIIPQYTKCEFVVVNGNDDDRSPLPFGENVLGNVDNTVLLGSHLTSDVSLKEEMKLHMNLRYKSVIKFYNFIRSNRMAPLKVKLKVLKSCVVTGLLHNCEAFGDCVPKDLETTYTKMLKSCFGVRLNVSNDILYVESSFLPIKAIILIRQFKFYQRFRETIATNSPRDKMFRLLLAQETSYLQHYTRLGTKYTCVEDIINEFRSATKRKIYDSASQGHYKYQIYVDINPDLTPSPFLDVVHPTVSDVLKFRLGSHYFPIETGRWQGSKREERLCSACGELGDEKHVIFRCSLIERNDITLAEPLRDIWSQPDVYKLFRRIKLAKFIR